MQNKRLIIILTVAISLLLIPMVAMQFTEEVKWGIMDFVVMGALLLGTGLLCELVIRKIKRVKQSIALCGVIVFVFLIIWAELAVGILGTPLAGS